MESTMVMQAFLENIPREEWTQRALDKYLDHEWRIENGRTLTEELEGELYDLKSTSIVVSSRGGGDPEGAIAGVIDAKSMIQHGYKKSEAFMHLFNLAWDRLTCDERFMITVMRIEKDKKNGIKRIMERLNYGDTQAYKKSKQAFDRLVELYTGWIF